MFFLQDKMNHRIGTVIDIFCEEYHVSTLRPQIRYRGGDSDTWNIDTNLCDLVALLSLELSLNYSLSRIHSCVVLGSQLPLPLIFIFQLFLFLNFKLYITTTPIDFYDKVFMMVPIILERDKWFGPMFTSPELMGIKISVRLKSLTEKIIFF